MIVKPNKKGNDMQVWRDWFNVIIFNKPRGRVCLLPVSFHFCHITHYKDIGYNRLSNKDCVHVAFGNAFQALVSALECASCSGIQKSFDNTTKHDTNLAYE